MCCYELAGIFAQTALTNELRCYKLANSILLAVFMPIINNVAINNYIRLAYPRLRLQFMSLTSFLFPPVVVTWWRGRGTVSAPGFSFCGIFKHMDLRNTTLKWGK